MGYDLAALKNQAFGISRGGIWFASGWVVGYGLLNGETAVTIAGALLTALGGGLTGLSNTNNSIVQAASQIPEMKRMDIADPKLAIAAKIADPGTNIRELPKEAA